MEICRARRLDVVSSNLESIFGFLGTVVGVSYGGMVAFKMAEAHPDLVRSLVVSGSVLAMTDSLSETTLEAIGVKSSAELLLPESVKGLKALLSVAAYRKLWFPDRLHRDFLEVISRSSE